MTFSFASLARALVLTAGACLCVTHSRATTLQKPLNLAELVQHSPQIVSGTVKSVTERRLGSLPYTEINVQVTETLRGQAAQTVTLRQIGVASPSAPVNGRRFVGIVPGMPQYTVGEHVLLFLGATGAQGFRTTVGLHQGKFVMSGNGLVNGYGNRDLFRNATPLRAQLSEKETALLGTTEGAADAATFTNVVRRAVSERWFEAKPPASKPGRKRGAAKLRGAGVQ